MSKQQRSGSAKHTKTTLSIEQKLKVLDYAKKIPKRVAEHCPLNLVWEKHRLLNLVWEKHTIESNDQIDTEFEEVVRHIDGDASSADYIDADDMIPFCREPIDLWNGVLCSGMRF